MKKTIALLLSLAMVVTMFGCTAEAPETDPSGSMDATLETTDVTIPSESEATQPEVTEQETTEPVTEPTATDSTEVSTEPTVSVTEPTVESTTAPTEPAATKPAATEPPAPTPKGLSASVNGSFEVGDTLKASDFTVKVTMSDGSVLTNPSGWSASTMKLTSTSNKITVTYKGLQTTVTVSAKLGDINGMALAKEALNYIGLTYVDGGNSLTQGTDCSGFTKLIFAKFGIELPRTPSAQNKVGTRISAGEARPGDLLVETYPEGQKYDGHSGIYIGNGQMISAMPGDGVIISNVHEGMDYLRAYDNSYLGTDEDAYFECLEALISLFHTGEFRGADVSWKNGIARFEGTAPNGNLGNGYLRLDIHDPKEGYESLLEAWKKVYLARDYYISMDPAGDNHSDNDYGYLNGTWYTYAQLREKEEAGEINRAVFWGALEFYGAFWNSSATITTGLGEKVDLSTCPGVTNYSALAKPGDPNEGKANLPPYNPDGSNRCAKAHKWSDSQNIEGTQDILRTCWYCDLQVTDSREVKDHKHNIEKTYFYGGFFEDSYAEYDCLTCGYQKDYVITPGKGADHEHDYSYNVTVVEPTCSMDGYTLHECVCTASYKDKIVECGGHDYGKTTTVAPTGDANGYDVKECAECGHKHKERYTEAP